MKVVRIIKDWAWPDLRRQTPGQTGEWGGVRLALEPVEYYDYVLVLNRVRHTTTVRCAPENIWALMQEPPCDDRRRLHKGAPEFARIFTTDPTLTGPRYVHCQPALPWHVNRDYDFLAKCPPLDKDRDLSWVTSSLATLPGHRRRLGFLRKITGQVPFDLFGRGFQPIDDKWDALAPYRYSLAVENHSNPYYWTEKISDCLLAWTMPIYHGCTRIAEYLPADCMIRLDIDDPDAVEKIREAVASDRWKKNRDAIAHARELILNKHQLFPLVAGMVAEHEAAAAGVVRGRPRNIELHSVMQFDTPLWRRGLHTLELAVRKLRRRGGSPSGEHRP
ncbi:MAG TPA: glycosyltransferase family 10 [Planctomycetota bacterium]|nr:glycosyltransferase family 10 [Planctomycetota bacterium]